MRKTRWVMVGLLLVGGCVAQEPSAPDPSAPVPDGTGVVTRTIVTLNADGTQSVRSLQLTVAQQESDLRAARSVAAQVVRPGVGSQAQAITHDTSCANSSLWIFDGTTQSGSDEILFFGSGRADLESYCRDKFCTKWWSGAVRSYWPGVSSGFFLLWPPGHDAGPVPVEWFAANQAFTVAGVYAKSADTLQLD